MKFINQLKYALFGLWYPVSYENYRDISYSKIGTPSHSIYWINLKTGKHKTTHYFNQGFMSDYRFNLMQKIARNKTAYQPKDKENK